MQLLKQLFLCVFLISSGVLIAQDFDCDYQESPQLSALLSTFNESNLGPDDNRPYVFKLHYWQIVKDDGTSNHLLDEQDFIESLAYVNRKFNPYNIFFKWDGVTNINSTEAYSWDTKEDYSPTFFFDNNYYVPGQLNIYILNIGGGSSGQLTADFAPIRLNYQLINHGAIIHEIGHNYGLSHTFGWFDEDDNQNDPNVCEHQTRDQNDPNYNADSHGDKLWGTYATPWDEQYPGVILDANCNYIGDASDCAGELYTNPEFKNYMSYTRFDCYREFKPAQAAKMRFTIREVFLNGLESLRDTIHRKELYQPYRGEYYLVGPATNKPPLFQPGFDYVFYDVLQAGDHPQPTPYEDTSFWYGQEVASYFSDFVGPIVHQNHTAVKILQLDQNKVRMCYNNFNRKPKDGTIIKFLDGVPNANVQITIQDSLQINDVNLLPSLEPGLYNIQKNYDDGGTQEVMILKNNE